MKLYNTLRNSTKLSQHFTQLYNKLNIQKLCTTLQKQDKLYITLHNFTQFLHTSTQLHQTTLHKINKNIQQLFLLYTKLYTTLRCSTNLYKQQTSQNYSQLYKTLQTLQTIIFTCLQNSTTLYKALRSSTIQSFYKNSLQVYKNKNNKPFPKS